MNDTCEHGVNVLAVCLECERQKEQREREILRQIMAGVSVPATVEKGLSVKEIYAIIRSGKKVALTLPTMQNALSQRATLLHHLRVLHSNERKLNAAFDVKDEHRVVIDITATQIGADTPHKLTIRMDVPVEIKRFSAFEIID